LTIKRSSIDGLWGIVLSFPRLSPTQGQVVRVLLSSPPRAEPSRLAWIKRTPIAVASGRINQSHSPLLISELVCGTLLKEAIRQVSPSCRTSDPRGHEAPRAPSFLGPPQGLLRGRGNGDAHGRASHALLAPPAGAAMRLYHCAVHLFNGCASGTLARPSVWPTGAGGGITDVVNKHCGLA
jgi:hypothetical protein